MSPMRSLRWLVVAVAFFGAARGVEGQSSDALPPVGEWVQPYRQLPGYWELIGRVVSDVPEVRQDRR